jgi:hypothetical protein
MNDKTERIIKYLRDSPANIFVTAYCVSRSVHPSYHDLVDLFHNYGVLSIDGISLYDSELDHHAIERVLKTLV